MEDKHVITHDLGTTGNKACLYAIGDSLRLLDSFLVEYPLHTTEDGGAEQDADDWWNAVCTGTRTIMERTGHSPANIDGISFTTQLQGSILVDRKGNVLRRPMIWLDGRAVEVFRKHMVHGIKIEGFNWKKILRSLYFTGGGPATPKDPVFKYLWVKENEPQVFERVHKWLDVKDYLIMRCTGNHVMTGDSAHLTWVYDTRPGKLGWHPGLCRAFGIEMEHLPTVIGSTDTAGKLTEAAAREMGLEKDIPVFGGGGDASNIPIGAGCFDLFDTHFYVGTSGWVVSNVNKRMLDLGNFCASILGSIPGFYNYVAEMETTGICLQWVRDHLALDEIGVYLDEQNIVDKSEEYSSLYDFMNTVVDQVPPGAGNVIFTPWLHGNRAPREDPFVRGMFFNIGLNTGKRELIRSVLEGVAFNFRWCLEAVEKKIPRQEKVRFAGGGAKSDVWAQIMADVTGRVIEITRDPQNAGAVGAAIICGVGLGAIGSFDQAAKLIEVEKTFTPRSELRALYDRNFEVFKSLYESNKKLYRTLNHQS